MADVTISSLDPLSPLGSHVLPISDGTTTGNATIASLPVDYNNLTNKPTIPAGVPVGAVFHIATSTTPAGYLICNGNSVPNGNGTVQGITADYSALFSVLGSTYGSAGRLPDLRGEFIRGWDNSRGIDPSRTFGSSQVDAFQGHRHALVTGHWGANTPNHDSNWLTRLYNINENTRDNYAGDEFSNGVNGTPRTASETRPRNLALLPVIKY